MDINTFTRLRKEAIEGNDESMYVLAVAYQDGVGLTANPIESQSWMQKAADKGNANALKDLPESKYRLALAYRDGLGIAANLKEFFRWIKEAAEANHKNAKRELALAYKEGLGTKPDISKYVSELQSQAEENENQDALYELAFAYQTGLGSLERDGKEFSRRIKELADLGNSDAMYELAFAYRYGVEGVDPSLVDYFDWIKKLADRLSADGKLTAETDMRVAQAAMFHLAFAYKNGDGTEKSEVQFFKCLQAAAGDIDQGNSGNSGQKDAMFHLAIAYRDSEGTDRSLPQFFKWMRLAAEEGLPAAMYQLALAYWELEYNAQEFDNWAKAALKAGHSRAFIVAGIADIIADRDQDDLEAASFRPVLAQLNEDLQHLLDLVEEERLNHVVRKEGDTRTAFHFTNFTALGSMLPKRPSGVKETNCLRLFNLADMNDPLEGLRLLDKKIELARSYVCPFFDGTQLDSTVYIGSFTLKGDELDLWRAYGRDGTGVCIATPLDAFDKKESHPYLHGGEVVEVSSIEDDKVIPLTLYAIHYNDEDVERALDQLKDTLDRILKSKARTEARTRVDQIVREIIGRIRFLFKNHQYATEREARLVVDFDITYERLKLDQSQPSRIFVESPMFLFANAGSEIIIGPTVAEKAVAALDIKYRLARNPVFRNVEVKQSTVPYRRKG